MSKKIKKNTDQIAALEICSSELYLVVICEPKGNAAKTVRTRRVRWRNEAPSLNTDAGVQELTSSLKLLATEEKLSGIPTYVALNGDFCVTRVVAGTAEEVRHDMRSIEDRTNLYLSLGAGEKCLAAHVRQVDMRHQHGWLAVANLRTLESLVAATDAAGLSVELMEPSLLSLCRAIEAKREGNDAPALVVSLDERGVQVGISYQGRLLLDYRPGGRQAKEEIATTVRHHLDRLQRYCDRHFRFAGGSISRLYLCGDSEAVQELNHELSEFERLDVEVLTVSNVREDLDFDESGQDTELVSALGAALAHGTPASERNGPNLLDRTKDGVREPLVRGLLTAAWPAVAALLLAIGLSFAAQYENAGCRELQAALDVMATDKQRIEVLQVKYTATERKLKHLRNVKLGLEQQPLQDFVEMIAKCLPSDVWLENLSIGSGGRIAINGASYTEKGVYEFVGYLRNVPQFAEVALQGTEPARSRTDSTQFSVSCQLADQSDSDGGAE